MPSRSFYCTYPDCGANYRRREHLKRHVAAHHEKDDRFSCPYCESTLTRSDLLRRHIRIYHPRRDPLPSRVQKACSACHARKERCHGGFPCSACEKRGVPCLSRDSGPEEQRAVDANVEMTPSHRVRPPSPAPAESSILSPPASGPPRWVAQDYIDIYFREFHPKWPFLHRGTFDPSHEPCILIQSIVMIGLWIEGGRKSRDSARDLHRSLCAAIHSQMDRWYVLDSTPDGNQSTPWPIATFQSVLLQSIFALLLAGDQAAFDLNLRYCVQPDEYKLLLALVQTCRRTRIFCYPEMLAQHSATAPLAMVWVSVEEIKRFGLALYKVCRMTTCAGSTDGDRSRGRDELLTLADLSFGMPDSDELWDVEPGSYQRTALKTTLRDNRDSTSWVSVSADVLYDAGVDFDWI
ncbi:hypothetical protein P168DRAFT_307721 [Aspergillus campestris IBT 28561]|uniref:C6 and C2H2 transcription factor n=1 Tax=Aspergillus campestris (strain IBT 28561) TaxID=1392248 RepID=A0A2I1CR15_ASPC2|nr:uncharacterized protein P168DRAFT_307721 [Aspergillus campestris IBT 28561]PKY00055.1 hypothetical protein P168DRAFT_307721 [Aspergillus campestris IBT 28561]